MSRKTDHKDTKGAASRTFVVARKQKSFTYKPICRIRKESMAALKTTLKSPDNCDIFCSKVTATSVCLNSNSKTETRSAMLDIVLFNP